MIEIKQLLNTEGALIAKMFQRNQIYAKVDPSKSVYKDPTSGFIRYSLILRADQRFDAIEKITRELSDALSRQRERMGLPCPINAIPVSVPSFALEVPHPMQQVLLWSPRKITTTRPHTMLIGRSYSGKESKDETVNLADSGSCHALIVGITGAGKSVLLQNMMLSLTASTSPDDLKIVIVDLKNEDMLPFRHLPHVMTFAGTKDQAIDAIRFVYEEKEKRIVNAGYKPYRLVLWIDEMAQLAAMKECAEMLGDLASIGRGKLINLVGATQHPTEKGGLGGLLKANFPVRLVGMVASGQSYVATGRPKIHADLLPGKGAFLRIQGPQVQRFQSFNIEANDVELMANHIAGTWNKGKRQATAGGYEDGCKPVAQPVITGYHGGYERLHTRGTAKQDITGYGGYASAKFPVNVGRPLTESEAQAVRQLAESGEFDYNGKPSLNKLTLHVYGSKDPSRLAWVKETLEKVSV